MDINDNTLNQWTTTPHDEWDTAFPSFIEHSPYACHDLFVDVLEGIADMRFPDSYGDDNRTNVIRRMQWMIKAASWLDLDKFMDHAGNVIERYLRSWNMRTYITENSSFRSLVKPTYFESFIETREIIQDFSRIVGNSFINEMSSLLYSTCGFTDVDSIDEAAELAGSHRDCVLARWHILQYSAHVRKVKRRSKRSGLGLDGRPKPPTIKRARRRY